MVFVTREILTTPGEVPVLQFFEGGKKGRLLDIVFDRHPPPDDALLKTFVPDWEAMQDNIVWDTPFTELVRDVLFRLEGGIPSRYEGVPGVGKTEAIKVACALKGLRYNRHNYSPESDPGDTIGRFIPTDPTEAIKWDDISKLRKEVSDETVRILTRWKDSCARFGQRPLSPLEIVMILKEEKLTELLDFNKWKFQKGSLYFCMENGVVYAADEPNFAHGAVLETENPALEEQPTLRIPQHENEVIRELTEEEKSLVASGVVIPNVINLAEGYCYQAAQNPWGMGNRKEESAPRRNRLSDRLVEALTAKEYEEFLRQKILGLQPDIEHENRTYKGGKVKSPQYKEFQDLPNVSVVIKWLAKFQTDMEKLEELGKIGTMKDMEGGSYTWSRRNLIRFLKDMKTALKCKADTSALFTTGETKYNSNWHDAFIEALNQEFLKGMYKEDRDAILQIIEKTGIEDYLGPSVNNPKQPEWMTKAQAKGVKVQQPGSGKYTISKLDLVQGGIAIEEFEEEVADLGYKIDDDSGDLVQFHRQLKSIQTLWVESEIGTPKKEKPELLAVPNEDIAK